MLPLPMRCSPPPRATPTDDDIAVLAAEAAMNTRPWDYWEADKRTPKPRIGEAVRLVEAVLARSPATHRPRISTSI